VTAPDFGARAADYDRLRPAGEAWWDRFDALVRLGELRGKRVLEVGCGTGAVAAALAEHAAAKVWGVEPSAEMLAVAQARVPRGVGLKQGRAEELPFRDGWFDAVVFSLVVHLVDRPRAFAEARRVLVPDGLVVIATFAHEHFDRYWAGRFFPSLAAVDHARFPTEQALREELRDAGFTAIRSERVSSRETLDRALALERLRGRHISTFDLLDEAEVASGIERAERELPDEVVTELEQLVIAARASA
jgi:ubiquinone/menaquinone biosynthesis C-methylase UbiE